jgi:hypothetical protein
MIAGKAVTHYLLEWPDGLCHPCGGTNSPLFSYGSDALGGLPSSNAQAGVTLCYDRVVWQRQAIRHGGSFFKHVIPAIIKPMHALWNEVVGFFFLCFAAIFGFRTAAYYRSYVQAPAAAAPGELMRVVVAGFFGLVMAWFGVSSFLRARKISRS